MSKVIVFIKYKQPVSPVNIDALSTEGAEIKDVIDYTNTVIVKLPSDKIEKLKSDPNIEWVETDQEAHALGFPSDMQIFIPSGVQTIPWGVQKIRAPEVWNGGNKGTAIKIAIVDTGIFYDHPDLKANYKGGHNYITNTDDPKDDNGHGTHVSGIIAANGGIFGVAPEASIYAYKVLDQNGSGSYSNIMSAIRDAIDNGMHAITMSLGGTSPSQALKDICGAAYNSGIVIIAAAGNSGGDGSTDTVLYPAKYSESVIAVAATDSSDARASFSSCGSEVEVAAPGVSIPSTVPISGTKYSDPSGYMSLSGTSMATPHVTATVALILKAHPEFKPADVRNALDKGAVDLGSPGKDVLYGNGRIDVKAAVDLTPPPPPQPPVLTKITVSPASATVVFGTSQQFKATALDQYNSPMPSVSISWTIDNPVGTITPPSGVTGTDGTVSTTFNAGALADTATLTATSGNISGSSNITVKEPSSTPVLTKILISPPSSSLVVGGTQQFKATALDHNDKPMASITIGWEISTNPAVGKVNPIYSTTGPDGTATTTFAAVNPGTCFVKAKSGNVYGLSTAVVSAPPPPPAGKNFKVTPLGVPGHLMGVIVMKVPINGDHTADEACKDVCDLLKKM